MKYNTTVDNLKDINNLTSNTLSIGQRLRIPTISDIKTYTVKKGDTLYGISKKYNISVDTLKSLNNLTDNILSIGQILLLEPSNEVENTYIVKKGDTLYSIARKNNTTVDTIKNLNNLTSNLISLGQELKLPENI